MKSTKFIHQTDMTASLKHKPLYLSIMSVLSKLSLTKSVKIYVLLKKRNTLKGDAKSLRVAP